MSIIGISQDTATEHTNHPRTTVRATHYYDRASQPKLAGVHLLRRRWLWRQWRWPQRARGGHQCSGCPAKALARYGFMALREGAGCGPSNRRTSRATVGRDARDRNCTRALHCSARPRAHCWPILFYSHCGTAPCRGTRARALHYSVGPYSTVRVRASQRAATRPQRVSLLPRM